MGGFSNIFGGGGSKVLNPYTGFATEPAQEITGQIQGLMGNQELARLFAPNAGQQGAMTGMQNFDPSSYFSGAMGMLGGAGRGGQPGTGAFGMMDKGAASLGGDQYGGGDLLKRTIGGEFTDVTNNPVYQARNAAIQQAAQKMLNANLDQIGGQTQLASGGVGRGSTGTAQKARAVQQAGENVAGQIGQLSAQDLAAERANQMNAMGQGTQLPMQMANAWGNLGQGAGSLANILGNFGGQMGQMNLANLSGMGQLGGQLAQQGIQGFLTPFSMQLELMNALKSGNVGASGGGILPTLFGLGSPGGALG